MTKYGVPVEQVGSEAGKIERLRRDGDQRRLESDFTKEIFNKRKESKKGIDAGFMLVSSLKSLKSLVCGRAFSGPNSVTSPTATLR